MPLTQAQLVTAVAERTQLSKSDAKRALAALDEVVLEELGNAQKVRIGGLVQLTVRVKPAQKPRKGRNPATGEEITVAAKPASVDLRARPLARAKGALPSVQKARRRLAASPPRLRLSRLACRARNPTRSSRSACSRFSYRPGSSLPTTITRPPSAPPPKGDRSGLHISRLIMSVMPSSRKECPQCWAFQARGARDVYVAYGTADLLGIAGSFARRSAVRG